MSKISTIFNNFSRAKLDHDINSRTDVALYTTGCDLFKNFYSNFKGNAIYRGGLENIVKFQDCAFIPFKFSNSQSYILLFYNTKFKVLTYDSNGNIGFVQSGGSDLEVATPYNLAQSKEIAMHGTAQIGDLMYITHPSFAPYKLTRASATSFTLATFVRTADPFTGENLYPSVCGIHDGALYYGNSNTKKTTIWRSKIGDYENMTTGTAATDGFELTIAELTEPITWIRPAANSLVVGSTQALVPVNGGGANVAITPTNVTAKISDTDGANTTVPIKKDNLLFYIDSTNRRLNYFSYDIIAESFQSADANIASYDITDGGISKLCYKQDKQNLVWSIRNSTDLLSLNFNKNENIIGWHEHESVADIKDIAILNDNTGKPRLIALAEYNSMFFICRLFDEIDLPTRDSFYTSGNTKKEDDNLYNFYIAERLKEMNYLDISSFVSNYYTTTITYVGDTAVGSLGTITSTGTEFLVGHIGNRIVYKTATGAEFGVFEITGFTGTNEVDVKVLYEPTAMAYSSWYRSFNTISGLTDFIGDTVSVVADGGYLGDFVVDGSGEIALEREVNVACVGFGYEGIIKTFNLGLIYNGVDTHYTAKSLSRCYMSFIQSSGVEIGSSLYKMAEIQEFKPSGFYDLPPLPIDGISQAIAYVDSYSEEKSVYIRQNKPLRCHITGIMCEVDQVLTT